jgi:hypothetical protein
MNKIKTILVILVGLIGLVACEEGGSIKINNQTSHNVYTEIEGVEYTISGSASKKVNVDTSKKIFLFSDGQTTTDIKLVGETYRIWDEYNDFPQDYTSITVTAGETYNIYCSPTTASVKIVNNSNKTVDKLSYRSVKQFSVGEWFYITYDPPLANDQFAYYHLNPQTQENRFFYNFKVEGQDQVLYSIGDEFEGVELFIDDQHLIIIEEND